MADVRDLIKRALANKKNSYSPYSNFRVSAVVETKAGNIYEGVNIENAAYPLSLCAERSAMSTAITAGERDFKKIVIVGDSEKTFPCGACRQFIAEFADEDTEIIIAADEDTFETYKIADLLPHSFSSKDLR